MNRLWNKFLCTTGIGDNLLYIKCDYWCRELVLKRRYYTKEKQFKRHEEKVVIFMVDGKCFHGGLADRLKGIMSLYYECKRMGIVFKIFWRYPFRLEDFLCPNSCDWSVDDEFVCYNRKYSNPCIIFQKDSAMKNVNIDRWIQKKINQSYNQIHAYMNTKIYPTTLYHILFNELFKPTVSLQTEIDYHIHQMNNDYVSVSFRFLGLLGDFNEKNCRVLDNASQILLMEKCKMKLLNLFTAIQESKIFVASDSKKFQKYVSDFDFVYIIKGGISHIDTKSVKVDQDSFQKTFLDFLIISKAKRVYLFQTDGMYKSDFPYLAACVGNVEFIRVSL